MPSKDRPMVRLALSVLEDRDVPSADLVFGALTVRGSDLADHISINRVIVPGTVFVQVNENGQTSEFPAFQVHRVRVFGNDGHDTISNNIWGLSATMYGGDGDDAIFGSGGRDYLNGGSGNDTLHGWGGSDTLVGGAGDDKLYGGDGYDFLYGDAGDDWLNAGSRAEFASGGTGRDFNAYVWAVNGARATDINQGIAQTSVFLSSLAAVARTSRNDLARQISYVGDDTYTVHLFVNGIWRDVPVQFNGNATRDPTGIYDCLSDQEGEFWPLMYQRAYMLTIGYDPYSDESMAAFAGEETANRALTEISGRASQSVVIDATLTPEKLQWLIRDGYAVTGTYATYECAITNVVRSGGTWFVRIYDPLGKDQVQGPAIQPLPDGANDGSMTITWADFMATFDKYSWA